MSKQPSPPTADEPEAGGAEAGEPEAGGTADGSGAAGAGDGTDAEPVGAELGGAAGAANGAELGGADSESAGTEAGEPDMDDVRYSRRRRRARQLAAEDPTPRLPRGRFFRFAFADLMRIGMLAALLVAVFALRKPCGESAATFIGTFEEPADAAPAADPLEGYELVPAEELLRRLRDGGPVDLEAETAPATEVAPDGEAAGVDQEPAESTAAGD